MNDSTVQKNTQLGPFAQDLHRWGANVIAIKRGTKKPLHNWKTLQTRVQTQKEVDDLPWDRASAVGILNGPDSWRVFDIDAKKDADGKPLAPVDERVLVTLLSALGLPDDYQWSYRSGSGAGWGVVIRCDDALPGLSDTNSKGVYIGLPSAGYDFGQLELRWSSGYTIIDGLHPTGPGYRWRSMGGERPFVAPAMLSAAQVAAGFGAIAYQGVKAPGSNGSFTGFGLSAQAPAPGSSPYGIGALKLAITQVAIAAPGTRNNTLYAQATALAELVNGNQLDEAEVTQGLTQAAELAGLEADEIKATIESAFAKVGGKARQPAPKTPKAPKIAPTGPTATKATPRPAKATPKTHRGDPTAAPLDPQHEYRLEDTGNAERFAARYRDSVRYDHSSGNWLIWAGSHWQIDNNGAAQRLAKATVYSLYQEATEAYQLGNDERASTIGKWARVSSGEARRNAMLNLARSERPLAITHDQLNGNSYLLNCLNGTLDLTTGDLRPHDRDDLITYCLPFDYDPQAPAPLWDSFLEKITGGDRQLAGFLARAVGYSLGGEANEQCLFFLHGFGANGKSTFIEAVMSLLGDMAIKARAQVLMQEERNRIPDEIAALAGKRLVVSSELSDGARLNEGLVKDLTGGDSISARFLYGRAFTFRPTFRLWLYGNHKPIIMGTDNGIWRRIRLIPFTVSIPEDEQDPDFSVKLRQELPGILAWAVRGRKDYQRQGLAPPQAVTQATASYRTDSDTLGQFLEDSCAYGPNMTVKAGDLYAAYTTWAETNGLKALSNVRLARALAERGLTKARDSVGRWNYEGIGLLF